MPEKQRVEVIKFLNTYYINSKCGKSFPRVSEFDGLNVCSNKYTRVGGRIILTLLDYNALKNNCKANLSLYTPRRHTGGVEV